MAGTASPPAPRLARSFSNFSHVVVLAVHAEYGVREPGEIALILAMLHVGHHLSDRRNEGFAAARKG